MRLPTGAAAAAPEGGRSVVLRLPPGGGDGVRGGVQVVAVELGAGYSEHAVVGFREPSLEIYRVCAGGKLTLQPERSPFSAYGRMGWFYRFSWDPQFDYEPYDQDGGGYYLGCGLECELDGALRVGVFVDYFKGRGVDPLEERMYGLSVGVGF